VEASLATLEKDITLAATTENILEMAKIHFTLPEKTNRSLLSLTQAGMRNVHHPFHWSLSACLAWFELAFQL
jgi:hypothetical protein